MAQLLFVSCLFLLFHSIVERNRTGGLVTKVQSLLNLAMDSGWCKAGFCGNLPHGFVLGLKVYEFLEVFGFGEAVFPLESENLLHEDADRSEA